MLEKLGDGQRSGVSPLVGFVFSQNQLKVRRSRVSRNAVCRGVSALGATGPETPVIDVAEVQAATSATQPRRARRNRSWIRVTMLICWRADNREAELQNLRLLKRLRRWLQFRNQRRSSRQGSICGNVAATSGIG